MLLAVDAAAEVIAAVVKVAVVALVIVSLSFSIGMITIVNYCCCFLVIVVGITDIDIVIATSIIISHSSNRRSVP